MEERTQDGSTREEYLKRKAASFFSALSERVEAERELEQPEMPEPFRYLLDMFNDLQRRRTGNGFALLPLDIEKWAGRNGYELAPFEWETLEALDHMVLRRAAAAAASPAPKKEKSS